LIKQVRNLTQPLQPAQTPASIAMQPAQLEQACVSSPLPAQTLALHAMQVETQFGSVFLPAGGTAPDVYAAASNLSGFHNSMLQSRFL
jgi:hypothetical protein